MLIIGSSLDGYDWVVLETIVSRDRLILNQDDSYVTNDPGEAYTTYEEW